MPHEGCELVACYVCSRLLSVPAVTQGGIVARVLAPRTMLSLTECFVSLSVSYASVSTYIGTCLCFTSN